MKRLLLVAVLAVACLAVLVAPSLASAQTFFVHPSGGNDTGNIQAAFNAALKAGSGSVVQLTAGHFSMNNILVAGFHGTFKGAGEGATVIDTRRRGVTLMAGQDSTRLIDFHDGDVRVSDMSFDITPFYPAKEWTTSEFGGPNDYLAIVISLRGESSAAIDRVSFMGHAGGSDNFGANTNTSVGVENDVTPSGGTFTMTRCTFATQEGVGEWGLTGARITIGGSACQGNVFDSASIGCSFGDSGDTDFVVSYNQFHVGHPATGDSGLYSAGVSVSQGVRAYYLGEAAPAPSRYLVSHNSMCVAPPADGVDLFDYGTRAGAGPLLDAVVSGNAVVLAGSPGLPAVYSVAGVGELGAQAVQVLDNRISGVGLAGIYLGIPLVGDDASGSVSGWKIIGNDVSHMTAVPGPGPDGTPVQGAPIWLGPGTTACTVIGGRAPTLVLDQGRDNILKNVTVIH